MPDQSQGSPGGGPNSGGPGGGPNNGGPGNGWGNNPGNWTGGGNGWNGGSRGNRNRRGNGYYPQQFSGSYFTRPYPYHLDYYKMRYGGSYAPYYGNLYGPSNSVYPAQYNGDYGPNNNGQNEAGQINSGSNDANSAPIIAPPPTMGDPGYSNGRGEWCWIPYSGSPYYGAAPPTFESVGPTYERGPIYHGPIQVFYPGPREDAQYNSIPNAPPASSPADQSNSQTSSQPTGGNAVAPTLRPAQ